MIVNIIEALAFLSFLYGVFLIYIPAGFLCMGPILYVVALWVRANNAISDEDDTE